MLKRWQKRSYKMQGFMQYMYSLALMRYSEFNLHFLRRQVKAVACDRLQIGCGLVILDGWLNVLFERRQEYGRLVKKGKAWFLNYNLLHAWPVEQGSLSYVAGSHVIEHLDLNQSLRLLKFAHEALKPGGVIRLSCPDLEKYARAYIQKDQSFYDHALIKEWCAFKAAQTPSQIFAAKAYDSGGAHKWFHDYESLKNILERSGFVNVRKVSRLEGEMVDLEKLELPQRELETVYVEAVKKK